MLETGNSRAIRLAAALSCFFAVACSNGGGGGGSSPAQGVQAAAPAASIPPNEFRAADTATLGTNAPLLATGNTTLGTMPVNTVLPLRQSIVLYTNGAVLPDSGVELGGATLTYKGTQTVNGVTGPVFELNVPKMFVTQTLLPDGTGGPCCDFNDVNGKVTFLNYTMTGTWNAVNDGTTCAICTSMFVTGFQTPSANMPASGQATYLGNGANGSVSGNFYLLNGPIQTGTISGSSSNFAINFGNGQVTGTLSGLKATPVSATGVMGAPQDWNQIDIAGSLSGAVLSGTTTTPSQPAGSLGFGANSTGAIGGALFGPNAEELGAVWSLQDQAGVKTAFGVVSATKQ
jgi:hypothetical protein